MGSKGDRLSEGASHSVEILVNKLSTVPGIGTKKMFGGCGIFHDGKMFALVNTKGEIFMKADDSIRPKFDAEGARQHGKMPCFALPEDVLNDPDKLVQWAWESINISK